MENTEIIKTEDPNIVIQRTTTDTEVDISNLSAEKIALENGIEEYQTKINALKSYVSLPISVQKLVDDEIALLNGNIYSCNERITSINKLLI